MKLKEIYSNKENLKISFEVFPPKETDKYKALYSELENLKKHNPAFISLTWGAGGNNNNSTELIKTLKNTGFEIMPHFTCVSSSKKFVGEHLTKLKELNIENILALRGDLPEDISKRCTDFNYANELVEYIKHNSDLSIGVAGYPEGHIECAHKSDDIHFLKEKVDAGCDFLTTQMFFDNNIFYNFLYRVKDVGINVPIVPGIMPITTAKQLSRSVQLSGTSVPERFKAIVDHFGDDPVAMRQAGIIYATEQIIDLIANGITHVHVYSMNKPDVASDILYNLKGIIG